MNLFPPSNSASPQAPQNSYYVPIVIESDGRGERSFDIYSRLLKDRIIFITTPIDDGVAASVIAQLLFLQMQDPKKDIHIYINSTGGSVTAGLAMYDTMQFLTCDVNTYCIGIAASMGSVLLTAGTIPHDHLNTMRCHPDFETQIVPHIEAITMKVINSQGDRTKVLKNMQPLFLEDKS
jgi:hypothetical protein